MLIYLGWRDDSHPFFRQAVSMGLGNEVNHLRQMVGIIKMPDWFVYSLPDGLWMFAFVLFIMALWDFRLDGQGRYWTIASILSGLVLEISQFFKSAPGSFDWSDILWMLGGGLLPVLFFTNNVKRI